MYVADTGNNRVVRINHVAGNWIQTTAASGLSRPQGVAVDSSGNLFIADTGNNRILEVSNFGLGGTTVIPTYGLNGPTSVSVGQGGTIVVADTGNNRVVELLPDGSELDLATGVAATGTAIAPAPTRVFVRDETNQQIWAELVSPSSARSGTERDRHEHDSMQTVAEHLPRPAARWVRCR